MTPAHARHAFELSQRFAPDWAHRLVRVDNGKCIVQDRSGNLWLAESIMVNASNQSFARKGMGAGRDGQWQVCRHMLVPEYGPVSTAPDSVSLADTLRASLGSTNRQEANHATRISAFARSAEEIAGKARTG